MGTLLQIIVSEDRGDPRNIENCFWEKYFFQDDGIITSQIKFNAGFVLPNDIADDFESFLKSQSLEERSWLRIDHDNLFQIYDFEREIQEIINVSECPNIEVWCDKTSIKLECKFLSIPALRSSLGGQGDGSISQLSWVLNLHIHKESSQKAALHNSTSNNYPISSARRTHNSVIDVEVNRQLNIQQKFKCAFLNFIQSIKKDKATLLNLDGENCHQFGYKIKPKKEVRNREERNLPPPKQRRIESAPRY